jgi:peptidyl-prolyl cis-trans isomerase B (cyclophilin B)
VAGKQERQRKLARERYQRKQAREAQRQHRTRKMVAAGAVIAVIAGAVVAGVLALTGGGHPAAAGTPSATPSIPTPSASPSASPSVSPSSTPVAEPAHHCTYLPGGSASRNVGQPPAAPDYKAGYQATISTNRGPIVIDLLNSKATCTVNSFVFLATKRYFDNTHCHRLTTAGIYVLQCGDPTGTGTGGPGYEFASENLAGARYPAGTLAMANTGQPNTNGSQFFLVYRDTGLPPSYTPFGRIVSGLNIIQTVAKAGSDNAGGAGDGHPKAKVVIGSVTIKKT